MFLAERWGQGEGRENERQGERKGGRRRETKSLENDSKIHKNFVFLIKQLPYSFTFSTAVLHHSPVHTADTKTWNIPGFNTFYF